MRKYFITFYLIPIVFFSLLFANMAIGKNNKKNNKKEKATFGAPLFQYNFRSRQIELKGKGQKKAWIKDGEIFIQADKIIWDMKNKIGRCYRNVDIYDKKNEIRITGGFTQFESKSGHSMISQKPVLTVEKESITVYADVMHRYRKKKKAVLIGNVKIETKSGKGFGSRGEYHFKTEDLTLSGSPSLHHKKNIHRADEIIFKNDKGLVQFNGNAVLMHKTDYILGDRILVKRIEDKKAKKKYDKNGKLKKSYKQKIFCHDDVILYNYNKKKQLRTIFSGNYAEFDGFKNYTRLSKKPQMVFVEDNTIISSSVMEYYNKKKLANLKGTIKLVVKHRIVEGQFAQYFMDKKKIILMGNPIITELKDRYRADLVIYDTKNDVVSWKGRTIAVIAANESSSSKDKSKTAKVKPKVKTKIFKGGPLVTAVVGNVFISSTGIIKTNSSGVPDYGKRLLKNDFVAPGSHVRILDSFGWCDLKLRGKGMARLKGLSHLYVGRPLRTIVKINNNTSLSNLSTLINKTVLSNHQPIKLSKIKTSIITNRIGFASIALINSKKNKKLVAKTKIGRKRKSKKKTKVVSRPVLKVNQGKLFYQPFSRKVSAINEIVVLTENAKITNLNCASLISVDKNENFTILEKSTNLQVEMRFLPLNRIKFTNTNSSAALKNQIGDWSFYPLENKRTVVIDSFRLNKINDTMNLWITNKEAKLLVIASNKQFKLDLVAKKLKGKKIKEKTKSVKPIEVKKSKKIVSKKKPKKKKISAVMVFDDAMKKWLKGIKQKSPHLFYSKQFENGIYPFNDVIKELQRLRRRVRIKRKKDKSKKKR